MIDICLPKFIRFSSVTILYDDLLIFYIIFLKFFFSAFYYNFANIFRRDPRKIEKLRIVGQNIRPSFVAEIAPESPYSTSGELLRPRHIFIWGRPFTREYETV